MGGHTFFNRIAIVGVGLIGGSLGLALKRSGCQSWLVGVSRAETIDRAIELEAIDEGWSYERMDTALAGADLVVICTPIRRILELLPEVGRHAAVGALVTDVGSTKRSIAAAAACLPSDVYFVGGHPMAGSEKSGVAAADPFLFENALYILVPDAEVPQACYEAFRALLMSIGARVTELGAEEHDEVVAAISHLPQMIATSLVEMVGRLDDSRGHILSLAAGGFRDLTRIASSPFAPVWEDICGTNADRIRDMIDRHVRALQELRGRIGESSLANNFKYANLTRAAIPRDAKGFIHQLFEILVVAEDRPGIIAEIASMLSADQVNINDIEIMKVREGEGGTIRLGFDARATAARALDILVRGGYNARRP